MVNLSCVVNFVPSVVSALAKATAVDDCCVRWTVYAVIFLGNSFLSVSSQFEVAELFVCSTLTGLLKVLHMARGLLGAVLFAFQTANPRKCASLDVCVCQSEALLLQVRRMGGCHWRH